MLRTFQPLFFVISLLIIVSCGGGSEEKSTSDTMDGERKVEILEVVQATSYTYLRVQEKKAEHWIAVNKQAFTEGETIYYRKGLQMNDFESKDLQRTFDVIFFVQEVSREPFGFQLPKTMERQQPAKPQLERLELSITPPEGGISIGELLVNSSMYDGKTIVVRGKVTRVNTEIMNKNWIHLQDGSGDETNFDLTVTTQDVPQVGDIVTYSGIISLAKDFGSGYRYAVIMEQATRIN